MYFIQGQYCFQFFLAIQAILLESVRVLLIPLHICGSLSQISPLLVRKIPVEHIETLTVFRGFIVIGIMLVSPSVCVDGQAWQFGVLLLQ